jgi:phosphoserine phosphatase
LILLQDFLRLMQFSLTDLDSTLRAHLTPAVQSAQFQTVDANAVLADMLSLIEYDTPSGQYDFRAAEARLAQLHQHDAQQVAQLQQQQQQQQQVICTVSQPAPVPASIVTATTSTTSTPDAHGLDADDEKFIQSGL